jgi:predicted nucleic acid-binding protein
MGLRLALDTNCYVDFLKGNERISQVVKNSDSIFLPIIVLAELRAGFLSGTKNSSNEKVLNEFINSKRVSILLPDEQTSHFYAKIYTDLREKGKPIPTNDLWIAALTVQHNLILCSNDRHFDNIAVIARV